MFRSLTISPLYRDTTGAAVTLAQELACYKASQRFLVVLRVILGIGTSALSGLAVKAEAGAVMKEKLFSHDSRHVAMAWYGTFNS